MEGVIKEDNDSTINLLQPVNNDNEPRWHANGTELSYYYILNPTISNLVNMQRPFINFKSVGN